MTRDAVTANAEGSGPERILVRGVNWLGDAVMTTPALQRLREAKPNARITLLTHEKLQDLWQHHPALDEVMTFTSRLGVWQVARRLRRQQFDSALVFPNSHRSSLEAWLARIPRRIGLQVWGRDWLMSQVVARPGGAVKMRKRTEREVRRLHRKSVAQLHSGYALASHQIHIYLALAAAAGACLEPVAPSLKVTPEEVRKVRERFDLREDESWLGLNPGAAYGPAKRWPKERFVRAAIELQAATRLRWILLGDASDLDRTAAIAAGIADGVRGTDHPTPPINLAGRTSLRELCAVLSLCRVLLTNDTGPMHLAAALGTPVVVPFGSTSPELTGPGLPGDSRHRLLRTPVACSPCFRRECPIELPCLRGIAIGQVVAAVRDVFNLSSENKP